MKKPKRQSGFERIPQNVDLIMKECSKWNFPEFPPKNILILKNIENLEKSQNVKNLEKSQKVSKNLKNLKLLKISKKYQKISKNIENHEITQDLENLERSWNVTFIYWKSGMFVRPFVHSSVTLDTIKKW